MNHLEIFQEVYGKDHVFTVTELMRLQKVAELIVKEIKQAQEPVSEPRCNNCERNLKNL